MVSLFKKLVAENIKGNIVQMPANKKPTEHEPSPKEGKTAITPLVIRDLLDRQDFGFEKYGTVLKSYNGRNALFDAYQEALDLCLYLRQLIVELEDV